MTVIEWLAETCRFVWSRERNGFATKSEMRRWCRSNSVRINGEPLRETDTMPFPISSLVLFPKSNHRITML